MGDQHISFTTSKIGSLIDVNQCKYVLSFTCTKQEPVTYPNALYFSIGLVVTDGMPNQIGQIVFLNRMLLVASN